MEAAGRTVQVAREDGRIRRGIAILVAEAQQLGHGRVALEEAVGKVALARREAAVLVALHGHVRAPELQPALLRLVGASLALALGRAAEAQQVARRRLGGALQAADERRRDVPRHELDRRVRGQPAVLHKDALEDAVAVARHADAAVARHLGHVGARPAAGLEHRRGEAVAVALAQLAVALLRAYDQHVVRAGGARLVRRKVGADERLGVALLGAHVLREDQRAQAQPRRPPPRQKPARPAARARQRRRRRRRAGWRDTGAPWRV